jgi:CRP/FNR family cyclic AMP-dependent transcriptional regulator
MFDGDSGQVLDTDGQWPKGTLVAGLDAEARSALLAVGVRHQLSPGDRLLREGEVSRHAYVILEGIVKVTIDSADGRTALLAVRVAGDIVGEIACMGGESRMATVTAAGPVQVRVIKQLELNRLIEAQPLIGRLLVVAVGAKLNWSNRRRLDSGANLVSVKVARVLADLAAHYGRAEGQSVALGFGLTQPELAALIGASEPAVHRALTGFRRSGVVSTAYRGITIHDVPELRRLAELS